MQAPNSTQQHQTEAEVETSLILKLDCWTMLPEEQDTGIQQHQAETEVETSQIIKLDYWTMPPHKQDAGTQQHQAEAEVEPTFKNLCAICDPCTHQGLPNYTTFKPI